MSAATQAPGPGEHGYRVTPARFCAGCGDDVSAGCTCHAPSRELGKHWCRRCYFGADSAFRLYERRVHEALPDLLEALDDLSGLIRRGWTYADDIEVSRALDQAEAALKKARGE